MPFTVHTEAAKKQMFLNTSRPQEVVPKEIDEGWHGTPNQGLPVIEIPHFNFPVVLYLHPLEPVQKIVHRNAQREIVEIEEIPTEHLSKVVACKAHIQTGAEKCVDCQKALETALADGWKTKPYIPQAPPKPDDDIYGLRKKNLSKSTVSDS